MYYLCGRNQMNMNRQEILDILKEGANFTINENGFGYGAINHFPECNMKSEKYMSPITYYPYPLSHQGQTPGIPSLECGEESPESGRRGISFRRRRIHHYDGLRRACCPYQHIQGWTLPLDEQNPHQMVDETS